MNGGETDALVEEVGKQMHPKMQERIYRMWMQDAGR